MKKLIFILLLLPSLIFAQATGLVISNKPSGGSIGTAATTVDIVSLINLNQTTAGQTLTVPNLTTATWGKIINISNVGSVSLTISPGGLLPPGKGAIMRWTGSDWNVTGIGNAGSVISGLTLDYIPKSNSTGDNIVNGSWYFNGIHLTPNASLGSGVGDATHRLGWIWSGDNYGVQYKKNFAFSNNAGATKIILDSAGSLSILSGNVKISDTLKTNYGNISSGTANTMMYLDANKNIKSATIGTGLSFSTGTLTATGGGGTPGGSNTQLQYNNAGVFGGITGATTNGTSLTLVTPALGTPVSGVATNLTGTAAGLTAGNVTTNANLTGVVTSVGNATTIVAGAITNTMLAGSIDLTTKVTGVLPGLYGGTGIANSGKTITLGGNLATTGLFNSTLVQQFSGNTTLPPSTTILSGSAAALTSGRIPVATTNGLLNDFANVTANTNGIGIGATPTSTILLNAQSNQNAGSEIDVTNTTSGTVASSGFRSFANGGQFVLFGAVSTGFTSNGMVEGGKGLIYSNMAGGLNIGNYTNSPISLWINNLEKVRLNTNGDMFFGQTVASANLENFGFTRTVNAPALLLLTNASTGTSSSGNLGVSNGTTNIQIGLNGINYVDAVNDLSIANRGALYIPNSAGFIVQSMSATSPFIFCHGGSSATHEIYRSTAAGIAVSGSGTTKLTVPTAYLHLGAGMATANKAPLKLTTGTVNTTAESGALEYATPQLFFTNGGLQRQEIPLIQQSRVITQFDATTTTLANVTPLTATVIGGKTYRFVAELNVTQDAVGGGKFAISGTCTATNIIYEIIEVDNTSNSNTITSRQTAIGGSAGQAGTTSGNVKITGLITVNSAGTLTVMYAENAVSGTGSVLVGSTFVTTEIN